MSGGGEGNFPTCYLYFLYHSPSTHYVFLLIGPNFFLVECACDLEEGKPTRGEGKRIKNSVN